MRAAPRRGTPAVLKDVDASAWEALASRRIFFGHKSVGRNIVAGIRDILANTPEIRLQLVQVRDPSTVTGPALMEAEIGDNRRPATKTEAFANVLSRGFGHEPGAVAMYKYCYVDIQPDSDPEQLFRQYVRSTEALEALYPGLTLAHFTVPLHQARSGPAAWVKSRIGMNTQTRLNAARNRYNDALRERYGDTGRLFDLATIESTRGDGSRAYTRFRGRNVYMLAPEWTYDGGHLNDDGRYRVAEQFLIFLAGLGRD